MKQALILAGGKGTRLWPITGRRQKVIVDIAGRSFLEFILEKLIQEKFDKILFAVGYRSEDVRKKINKLNLTVEIEFVVEKKPLGTGGAIKNALSKLSAKNCLVINGDSFNDINYTKLMEQHSALNSDISILTKKIDNTSRYGELHADVEGRVHKFSEKIGKSRPGMINVGVYVIKADLFSQITDEVFSFESFLTNQVSESKIIAIQSDGYFIDIGTPEDLLKFKKFKE